MGSESDEFLNYLNDTKGLMPRTVEHYMGYYRLLNKAVPFTQDYCNKFIQDHKNHSIVRGMMLNLLELRKLNKIIDLPPKRTGKPKKRIIRHVSLDEVTLLKDYLYGKSFKQGLIFELIYQGALRRAEISTIKINSFEWVEWIKNMAKPCKLIVIGKGDKERVVLINPETAEKLLNRYIAKHHLDTIEKVKDFVKHESFIFKGISERFIYEIIHAGSLKCLSRDIRPHELRHARATELEKMGVPIRDIKVYLGHTNLTTTEIYLHTSDKKSIDNIQEMIMNRTP